MKRLKLIGLAVLLLCLLTVQVAKADDYQKVELILGILVDVSGSVDAAEYEMQRKGYVTAFQTTVAELYEKSASDPNFYVGPMAVNFMYWSGDAEVTVGWTYINSAAEAETFAQAISDAIRPYSDMTDISGAIAFGAEQIADVPFDVTDDVRKVLDISGDGTDNVKDTQGPSYGHYDYASEVEKARDAAIQAGITINGLPITLDVSNLDEYYLEHVVGGEEAFMIESNDFETLAAAIEKKITTEVTNTGGNTPEPTSMLLFGSATGLMAWFRRKRHHKK